VVQYQKYMFDNFVITCDEETCIAEPLDVEQPVDVDNSMESTTVDESTISDIQADDTEKSEKTEEASENQTSETITDSIVEEHIAVEAPAPVVQQIIQNGYTQEELDTAIAEAVSTAVAEAETRGYDKGYAEASSSQQTQQIQILEMIEKQVSALITEIDNKLLSNEEAALKLGLEAVRKILPSLEPDVAKKELTAFLSDNFARFRQENSLSFSFNPDMAAEIAPQLSKLAEKNDFEGRISVHKDINLGLSDCRVEWKNGGVEKSSSKILNKIEDLISK